MNGRRLWISHQRYKLLRAEASVVCYTAVFSVVTQRSTLRDDTKNGCVADQGIQVHFENQSLGNGVSRAFQEVFPTTDAMLFRQNTRKSGNNAVKMSLAFQDIARFKCFTGLNRLEYAFNVIQNWETGALQLIFIRWCLFFVRSYGRRR